MAVSSRGRGCQSRTRAAAAVACAALLLWLARGRGWGGGDAAGGTAELRARREFPRRAPADIAHRLADFSTLPHALSATPGSWMVEEERGNFSTWRYSVEWECGVRCSGRARVAAESLTSGGRGPAHAPPPAHRVHLLVRTCTRAALPPWSEDCDEMEITAEVESDGGEGAVLREHSRASCAAGSAPPAAGDAACEATLRAHRALHHAALERSI